MGRQVGFYMTREDEGLFLDFLEGTGDVSILPYTFPRPTPDRLDELPRYFEGHNWGMFWLFNRSVSSRLFTRFIKEQGHHVVAFESSVIEFSRSHPKFREPSVWQEGRIWAEFNYLGPAKGEFLPKEVEFEAWYEGVAKWIRKNFKRVAHNLFLGPGSAELREDGKVRLDFEARLGAPRR